MKPLCGGQLQPSLLIQKSRSESIGEAPFAQNFLNAVEKHKAAAKVADEAVKDLATSPIEKEALRLRALMEDLVAKDVRQFYFRIQGLSRVFTDVDRTFETMRANYKGIEDILGKISMYRSLKRQAEGFEMPEVEAYFFEQENIKAAEGIKVLGSALTLADPSEEFTAIQMKIESAMAKDAKDLIPFVFSFILERIKKVKKAVEAKEYDSSDVELGLHELRRALRWLQIFISSFPGFIRLVDVPLDFTLQKFYAVRLGANPKMEASPFLNLPSAKIQNPIFVPRQHYILLTDIIDEIGRKKDLAETGIFFDEAIEAIPGDKAFKESQRQILREKLGITAYDHQGESVAQMEMLVDVDLLGSYRQNLKELNPGIKRD